MTSSKDLFAIAFIPKAPAILSLASSIFVVTDILRHPHVKKYLCIRILFWLNVSTSIVACSHFSGTWALPRGEPGAIGAIGNDLTCNLQSSLLTIFGYGGGYYYAAFSIACYYTIKNDFRDKFPSYAERLVHFICIGTPLSLAIICIPRKYNNPAGPWCWIDSIPASCEYDEDVECIVRIPLYFRTLLLFFAILPSSITLAMLVIIYRKVKTDEIRELPRTNTNKQKSRLVIVQIVLFILSYGISYLILSLTRFLQWINGEIHIPLFGMSIFLVASQGFFNMICFVLFKNVAKTPMPSISLPHVSAQVIEDIPVARVSFAMEESTN